MKDLLNILLQKAVKDMTPKERLVLTQFIQSKPLFFNDKILGRLDIQLIRLKDRVNSLSKKPSQHLAITVNANNKAALYTNIQSPEGYRNVVVNQSPDTQCIRFLSISDLTKCIQQYDGCLDRVIPSYSADLTEKADYFSHKYLDAVRAANAAKKTLSAKLEVTDRQFTKLKKNLLTLIFAKVGPNENNYHRKYANLQTYTNSRGGTEGITLSRKYFRDQFNIPNEMMQQNMKFEVYIYNGGEDTLPVLRSKFNKKGGYTGLKGVLPLLESKYITTPEMGGGIRPIKVCKVQIMGQNFFPVNDEAVNDEAPDKINERIREEDNEDQNLFF
jgi:hypothetical protein